jgi:pimeloyl-ACP methyl ester carboxylesterase
MTSAPTIHRVPTVLGELAVREVGSGPTAVLWHSMFVDSTSWDRVVGELSAHRRLLLIDGPGHGRSDPMSRRSSIDECAVAALSALDALAPGSAVDWVGNAWGGHVGMSMASRYGERIRSLVALSSPTQPIDDRSTIAALALILRLVGPVPFLVSKIAEAQLTDVSRAHPSTLRILTDALARTERRSLARAVRSFIVDRADATESLASIVAPALFLASDDRGEWSPDAAAQAAASARNARSAVVTGARTLLAVEQPAAVAELITAFWAEHPAR